jgi:RHS repeat-associated protein
MRISSGTLPTDKQFTGQRLDETGLYYYGARYYDANIGRFISPDTIVPNPANPQSLNRYSYCINNPLKIIDPSGLDYVIVGGSGQGSDPDDPNNNEAYWQAYWEAWLSGNGFLGNGEQVIFLADIDPENIPWQAGDVDPRLQQLEERLAKGDLTDIKLIGFSEGAATVGTFLANIADNREYAASYRGELRSAMLLECPTGPGTFTRLDNYNYSKLNDLPKRLKNANVKISIGDAWNSASIVHRTTPSGEGWNRYSYDSRSWALRMLDHIPNIYSLAFSQIYRTANVGGYHGDIINNTVRLTAAYSVLSNK